MAEFWTIEQAQANAELFTQEFSNRQILIFGFGEPLFNVPIGVEYEDRNFKPAIRYRKVGVEVNEWKRLFLIEPATKGEVLTGIDDQKMVTPARLTEKLNQFGAELLGIPKQELESEPNSIVLGLQPISNESSYKIVLPSVINAAITSVQVKDHLNSAIVSIIEGGEVGQIINLKRQINHSLILTSSSFLKLSAPIILEDREQLDNITLQKIDSNIWVELARKKFTE